MIAPISSKFDQDAPASTTVAQPATPATTSAEPVDPVDAWIAAREKEQTGSEKPRSAGSTGGWKPRFANRWASKVTGDQLRVYGAVAYLALLIACLAAGTLGFLIGWTVVSVPLIAWPLRKTEGAVRRRMVGAGTLLLAALFVAWRLDAQTNLGVLALAGNKEAVVGITVLAGVLGAVTASRWWLMMQSGVWCAAIGASGWWLLLQPDSRTLLAEWRTFLPAKQESQMFMAPIPHPFGFVDALWLGAALAVLFATSAYAGVLIGGVLRYGFASLRRPSAVQGVALAIWLGALLIDADPGWAVGVVLLPLAAIGGLSARRIRDLALLPAALAAGWLTNEAMDVASNGLQSWWGPTWCGGFLYSNCTPGQQLFELITSCALLLALAVIGYGGRHWITNHFPAGAH